MALGPDELDYYALLGVRQDANLTDIKAGFRAFALRHHPDCFAGDAHAAVEATRTYRRGTEAYRVLCHPQLRSSYDEQLKLGKKRMDPQVAASVRPGRSGVPDAVHARARPFLARADQALAAGDLKQAKLNYQIALQHDPGSGLLRQRLAELESRQPQR